MIAHPLVVGVGVGLVKSSLLLAVGWGASRLLYRASAAARHLVWLTVIVGVLLIPLVGSLAHVPVRVLPAQTLPELTAAGSVSAVELPSTRTALVVAPPRHVEAPITPTLNLIAIDPGIALVCLWAAGAIALSIRLLVGMISVSRLSRRGEALVASEWADVLVEAAHQVDLTTTPRLVMSDQVEIPFAFRAALPTIVVPASAREWSPDRRRAVLLHELAHIQRRDLVSHTVAAVACALNWFNPFVWAAARQMRIESELASDEMVVSAGVRPSAYAQHLLDMVIGFRRSAPSVALAMARPKELEGRLVAILDRRHRHTRSTRRGAVVALVAIPSLLIGAAAPVRREPTVIQPLTSDAAVRSINALVVRGVPAERRAEPSITTAARSEAVSALSSAQVKSLLSFGTSCIINPMMMLLRGADSLQLSAQQADSIATLNRRYMIQLSRIWAPVSAYYLSRADVQGPNTPPPGSDPTRATIQALAEIVRDVGGLLTPEQRSRLSPGVDMYLDLGSLSRLVVAPGGVFMSLDQIYSIRGHGRGGG